MAEKTKVLVDEFGLNLKERAFADYYIETLNGTEAVKLAGYDVKTNTARAKACQLKKDPRIQAYITHVMDAKCNDRIASQDEVLEFLTCVMRNEYDAVRSNRPFLPKDRIVCAELLGKRYALFTEKVEMSNEVVINVAIEED